LLPESKDQLEEVLDKVRRHEEMVGSVSDTIPNYKERCQEAIESQLGAASKAYEMIMTKDVAAKDDEIERCKIQVDNASR
jgi:hypothetical protein